MQKLRLTKQKKEIIVYFRVPKRLHTILTKVANEEDKTLAAVVRHALVKVYL